MRILFIGSDAITSAGIERMMQSANLTVTSTASSDDGIDLASLYDYDLLLIDSQTDGMAPIDVVRTLRSDRKSVPVLMLSIAADVDLTVKALAAGADDVLAKPLHCDELLARINAIVRRSHGHAESKIVVGDMVIDTASQTVSISGQRVPLTRREYQILEIMGLRLGSTLTKEMFLDRLYGGMDEPEQKIIDVFMCKVRKKISALSGGADYIDTIWGRGYCLVDPTGGVREAA